MGAVYECLGCEHSKKELIMPVCETHYFCDLLNEANYIAMSHKTAILNCPLGMPATGDGFWGNIKARRIGLGLSTK